MQSLRKIFLERTCRSIIDTYWKNRRARRISLKSSRSTTGSVKFYVCWNDTPTSNKPTKKQYISFKALSISFLKGRRIVDCWRTVTIFWARCIRPSVVGQVRFATGTDSFVIEDVDGNKIIKIGGRMGIRERNDFSVSYGRGLTGDRWCEGVFRVELR